MKIEIKKIIKNCKRKLYTFFVLQKKPDNIEIIGSHYFLNNVKFDIDINSKVVITLGFGVKLSNVLFYIRGHNHKIFINNHSRVSKGIFWMEDDNGIIQIGENSTVESAEFACTEPNSSIEIGSNCMFSKEIEIRTGDSHSIMDLGNNQRLNYAKNVKIEDNVWLGARVLVLKGSKIESNVVVGTGSIVTNREVLKCNSIYTGNPVKQIKTGIYWIRKRVY
jgi:acetyltransferase-like isoleucine patch superfamily enzyme